MSDEGGPVTWAQAFRDAAVFVAVIWGLVKCWGPAR
jgi:hypothetical protein